MSHSHFDPSASVSSFASTTTGDTATPDASTANLLPPANDSRSSMSSPISTSSSSQATTSRKHPTQTLKTQTYPSNSNTPPKDYEQAFASLSSAWGFGASVPAKNPKSAKVRGDKKDKKEKQRKKDEQKASEGVGSSSSSPVPSTTSASSSSQRSDSPLHSSSTSTQSRRE